VDLALTRIARLQFLTFGFVIATITRDVQSAMSFNVYVQFSSMRSTDFYVTSPMMIMFLLLLSLITALCSVASGFFQFKHPQDKRWATLVRASLAHDWRVWRVRYWTRSRDHSLTCATCSSWWRSWDTRSCCISCRTMPCTIPRSSMCVALLSIQPATRSSSDGALSPDRLYGRRVA